MPRAIGQTAAAETRKQPRGKRQWDEASFLRELESKRDRSEAGIARELSRLSREGFEEKLGEVVTDEDMDVMGLSLVPDEMEYVWPYFENMQAFYQRAGTEGLAVLFYWSG